MLVLASLFYFQKKKSKLKAMDAASARMWRILKKLDRSVSRVHTSTLSRHVNKHLIIESGSS